MMLVAYRLRRAGAAIIMAVCASIAGFCSALVWNAVAVGWSIRLLLFLFAVTAVGVMFHAYARGRILGNLIKTREELMTNPDLGNAPIMVRPLTAAEQAEPSLFNRIFRADD